jgi:hypothetical protein
VIALIFSVRGKLDPKTVQTLLMTTGSPLRYQDFRESSPSGAPILLQDFASVAWQGGGMVQAYDAAYTTTLLSKPYHSFNDSQYLTYGMQFDITNLGNETTTYDLWNVRAIVVYTFADSTAMVNLLTDMDYETDAVEMAYNERTFVVAPGQSATVLMAPTPPWNLNSSRLPIYSGYIYMKDSKNAITKLPYVGAIGHMYDQHIVQDLTLYDRRGKYRYEKIQPNATLYMQSNFSDYTPSTWTSPYVRLTKAMGSRRLRLEMVSLSNSTSLYPNTTIFNGRPTLGNLPKYPCLECPRHEDGLYDNFFWLGQRAEGGFMPEGGPFKIVASALKIFGNPTVREDWEVTESVPFYLKYVKWVS